jgi:FtsP/CotA-like multicopper oxidase with cupredoxin domain
VRVDLRDPSTAGTSIIQCHVLHHAEAGMMAKVVVNP